MRVAMRRNAVIGNPRLLSTCKVRRLDGHPISICISLRIFEHGGVAETQCRTLGEPDTSDCGCGVSATMAFNSTKYEAPRQSRGIMDYGIPVSGTS
ncbi:hypothetical protein V8C35DRAFT_143052 [Trichoderma chlorosporum]